MKRTNTAFALITVVVAAMAITAGPAAALDRNATPVSSSDVSATPTGDYASINGIVGDSLAGQAAAAHQRSNYQSLNASVASPSAPAVTTTVASDSTGFDWGDASIGAAVALGLVLISLAAVRELRRHRRVAIGSRA